MNDSAYLKKVRIMLLVVLLVSLTGLAYMITPTRPFSSLIPIIFIMYCYRPLRNRVNGVIRLLFIAVIWLALMTGFNGPEKMQSYFEETWSNITHYYHQIKGDESNVEK